MYLGNRDATLRLTIRLKLEADMFLSAGQVSVWTLDY